MDEYTSYEQAFQNGYEKGYRDGKGRAFEEMAFPKFLLRQPEPTKDELDAIMNTTPVIITGKETIVPIYPYRWIPVTERLPEKPGYYLAYWHGHSCPEGMIDVLNFDGTVFPWTTLWKAVKNEVTHWMPLPQPPKE